MFRPKNIFIYVGNENLNFIEIWNLDLFLDLLMDGGFHTHLFWYRPFDGNSSGGNGVTGYNR